MRWKAPWRGGDKAPKKLWLKEPGLLGDSPEDEYLRRLRLLQVRRAYAGWEVVPLAGSTGDEGFVLAFSSERVVVMEPTLRTMAEAVSHGPQWRTPRP